jgi:hypothetical protein
MALFSSTARRAFLPQIGLASTVAIQWVALAAFLVIEDK